MASLDRRPIAGRHAPRPPRRCIPLLVAVMALLVGALVGPLGHPAGAALSATAEGASAVLIRDAASSLLVAPAVLRPPVQAPTPWGLPGEQLPTAALFASLLVAVATLTGRPARPSRAIPMRRGPPAFALPR